MISAPAWCCTGHALCSPPSPPASRRETAACRPARALAPRLSALCSNPLLALDEQAAASGDCLVTDAGFGLVATETVLLALCTDRPTPTSGRVDAIPAVSGLGPAVLASAIDVPASGARRIENGQMASERFGSDALAQAAGRLTYDDRRRTHRRADRRVARQWRRIGRRRDQRGPERTGARALLAVAARILSRPAVRESLKRAVARFDVTPPARIGDTSWARAEAHWPGGSVEERWLQTDEGYAMTSRVACEVALRLATGDRRPGAHTPGRLFGPSPAESVGAHILANGA